jgi:hypothetical protein
VKQQQVRTAEADSQEQISMDHIHAVTIILLPQSDPVNATLHTDKLPSTAWRLPSTAWRLPSTAWRLPSTACTYVVSMQC